MTQPEQIAFQNGFIVGVAQKGILTSGVTGGGGDVIMRNVMNKPNPPLTAIKPVMIFSEYAPLIPQGLVPILPPQPIIATCLLKQ